MRKSLLQGKLEYPGHALLEQYPEQAKDILAFWNAIWLNYLNKQETNALFWYKKLGCKLYNVLVRCWSHNGWVTSNSLTGRRWASVTLNTDKLLEEVTEDELLEIREKYQYAKYLLDCKAANACDLVRQNGKTKRTGLIRTGFRDAGNTQFGYAMDVLVEYEKAVKLNLNKAMDKLRKDYPFMKSDSATYDSICTGIFNWHKDNPYEVFTTGDNINDSRGRAISQGLSKVMNPISNKDARAALVVTYAE